MRGVRVAMYQAIGKPTARQISEVSAAKANERAKIRT